MILGIFSVPRVVKECVCRSSKDYKFTEIGDYKIHSTSLMPNIEFKEAEVIDETIDDSIFLNDKKTKLIFAKTIKVQNFLTTNYIGRSPLEFYGAPTKMGRKFILICKDGNPNYRYRYFGTEDAIKGYGRNTSTNEKKPR